MKNNTVTLLLGMNIVSISLSDISYLLGICFTITSFLYLIWKWRKEAKKLKS